MQHLEKTIDIHRLVQAVVKRLLDERVIGNRTRPCQIFRTGDLVRKQQRDQVLRVRLLPLRGCLAFRVAPQNGQGARSVPAPADFNIGASKSAWIRTSRADFEDRYENTSSRIKLWVWLRERIIALSFAAACSSKLNWRQKRLRRAISGAVNLCAKCRMQHDVAVIHLVKKALENNRIMCC